MLWADTENEHTDHELHNRPKRLSWRFIAARSAGHPVVVRLSRACARTLKLIGDSGARDEVEITNVMRQLQNVLADDACGINFYGERDVFQV